MIQFRRLSIGRQLMLSLLVAAVLALVAASAAFVLFERLTLQQRAESVIEPYAKLISVGAEGAVAFADAARAQEILETFRSNPQVLEAGIILADGRPLARYSAQPDRTLPRSAIRPDGVNVDFSRDTAELVRSLPDGAHLYLVLNLRELNRQTRGALLVFAAAMVCLLTLLTLGLLAALQRTIVGPISSLTETVERIRTNADYGRRVPAFGNDEVARLSRNFNAMMGAIQEREDDLRRVSLFQRTILDNVGFGIISVAPDGRITSFNPAAERLLGYSAGEVVGQLTPIAWHDSEELARRASELSAQLHETVAPGFEVFSARPRRGLLEEGEWTFIRKDGTRVPVHLSVSALQVERGEITGFVGLTYDLTERKQAEAELRRHKDQLEEAVRQRTAELLLARDAADAANQAKSAFLANMSHEIRTPLNGILGFAQILQRDKPLTERQARGLKIIDESGQHLLTLINDILDLARIDAAKLELYASPVTLPAFLQGVCDIVRIKAEEKGLSFVYAAGIDLPATVSVDEKRMRQVLLNLLSNAIKFTDSGRVRMNVTRLPGSPVGTARLRFDVEDNGIGMSEEQLSRLFTPFEQVAEAERREGGTGLGLAISRQLIRLMGGDIAVHSQPDAGSVFSFEIDVPVLPTNVRVHLDLAPPIGYEGERKKILVVDDVPENRTMLVDTLAPLGFEMADAGDGLEALESIEQFRPDLVLMDLMMPVMDGFEAMRRLRSAPATAKLPVIAASASATPEIEARSRDAGATMCLAKPIDQRALWNAIAELLNLTWIRDTPAAAAPAPEHTDDADLVPPPPDEIAVLRGLARMGNMRLISERADHVQALDPRYAAFAARLRSLAEGCQSKAIMNLVEYFGSTTGGRAGTRVAQAEADREQAALPEDGEHRP